MAKKRGLAARRARRVRKTRRNASHMVANPPVLKDLKDQVLPALGAFGLSKLVERIVYTQVQKRSTRWGRHAGVIAALGSFGGAWLLAHKVKQLRPYHDAIVMGAGIAAGASLLRNYIPKYGWVMADPHPTDVGPTQEQIMAQRQATEGYLTDEDELEAMAEAMADDAIGDRRVAAQSKRHQPKAHQLPRHDEGVQQIDDDLDALLANEDLSDLTGQLSGGWAH